MECISTVQYRVLLNDQPRGFIIPHKGLRQGDPLSPYIFIMCTEALIANIKKTEREKKLTWIKVARACPLISHLLFADDSFFFCKAKREECQIIFRNLKEYEVVSGQLINFQKSSIQFVDSIWTQDRRIYQTWIEGRLGYTKFRGNGILPRTARKSWWLQNTSL